MIFSQNLAIVQVTLLVSGFKPRAPCTFVLMLHSIFRYVEHIISFCLSKSVLKSFFFFSATLLSNNYSQFLVLKSEFPMFLMKMVVGIKREYLLQFWLFPSFGSSWLSETLLRMLVLCSKGDHSYLVTSRSPDCLYFRHLDY